MQTDLKNAQVAAVLLVNKMAQTCMDGTTATVLFQVAEHFFDLHSAVVVTEGHFTLRWISPRQHP